MPGVILPEYVHMPTLTELCEPMALHLAKVGEVFEQALASDLPVADRLCRHVRRLRGKMLRPILVLLAGEAAGEVRDEHYTLAAVVEMVHMATLVHDDVLDEADIRRKAVTVNRMTGNEMAVMLGDFLISRSFLLCSSIGCQQASQVVARAAATVCEGELQQLSHRDDFRLDEDEYLRIIERKTAALTAASCRLGAHYAGADERTVRALEDYGLSVGLAFQIVDDILDITGREEQAGKTLGTDARNGKPTLPLIHYLRTAAPADADRLLEVLCGPDAGDRVRLEQTLTAAGSLDYARRRAEQYVARAVASLECLPPSPARTQLTAMAEFITARDF